MPLKSGIDRQELKKTLESMIENINILAPSTESNLLKSLVSFNKLLVNCELNISQKKALEECFIEAERFVQNLELAKQAVSFVSDKLYAPESFSENTLLEDIRKQLNDTALSEFFSILKFNSQQAAKCLNDSSQAEFKQSAYRKGVGFNIGMWYHYALYKKRPHKLGRCTEQANLAFGYLYSLAFEKADGKKPMLFNRLERIDIDNVNGGHVFLLIDRNVKIEHDFKVGSVAEFLDAIKQSDTCVIVDPWNKENPYYPASDFLFKWLLVVCKVKLI